MLPEKIKHENCWAELFFEYSRSILDEFVLSENDNKIKMLGKKKCQSQFHKSKYKDRMLFVWFDINNNKILMKKK